MNKQETTRIVAVLQAFAPHYDARPEMIEVWASAMGDLPFAAVRAAVHVWIRERKHFPYPVEIREIIAERLLALPSEAEAWQLAVRRASAHPGAQQQPWAVQDAVRQAVSDIGGLSAIGMTTRIDTLRNQFAQAYQARQRQAVLTTDLSDLWSRLEGSPVLPEAVA